MDKGYQLRISGGPGRGLTHPLDTEVTKVGRATGPNQRPQEGRLFLHDDAVSRLHAEIIWNEPHQRFEIFHRSGTNLTYVNGEPVTERQLEVGDEVKMGGVTLEFQAADRRWAGEPDQEVVPLDQRKDLQRVPSRTTFAIRTPREPARAPEPTKKKVTLGAPGGGHLTTPEGHQLELKGNLTRVGGPAEQHEETGGFDCEYDIRDRGLCYRNLVIRWDELHRTYMVARGGGDGGVPVWLERKEGGLLWRAALEPNRQGVLRDKDVIRLGDDYTLVFEEKTEGHSVAKIQI